MNEILKKLLESEILTEASKTELEDAFKTTLEEAVTQAVDEAKADTIAQTKLELHEQYTKQKEMLIEAIDAKVNDFLISEMKTLKQDIKDFRDLEAEAGVKLAEEKKQLGKQLKEDMATLVGKLNSFLEARIFAEFSEIKDDLQEAKKLDFGRQIFEAFLPEYRKNFVDATKTESELFEAKCKLDKLKKQYKNVKKEKEDLYRKVKLKEVLSPLSGRQKDIMESILMSYETARLDEAYKMFINKVLKESEGTVQESVITESATTVKKDYDFETVIITGDTPEVTTIVESVDGDKLSNSIASDFMRLAGIR